MSAVKEILIHNLPDVCERLGESKEAVLDLVKAGRLELSPSGFITETAVSNLLVDRRIDRDRELQNASLERQSNHAIHILRQQRALVEVVRAALPRLLQEVEKRLKEPLLAETRKSAEDIALAEAARQPVRAK